MEKSKMQNENEKNSFVLINQSEFSIMYDGLELVCNEVMKRSAELKMYRKEELAKLFMVTTETIGQWVKSGAIPKPKKINKIPYWTEEVIQDFMKSKL